MFITLYDIAFVQQKEKTTTFWGVYLKKYLNSYMLSKIYLYQRKFKYIRNPNLQPDENAHQANKNSPKI